MILDTDKLEQDGEYRDEIRHRCFTDHFFLAEMMGFRNFDPVLHKPAVDLYFPKNPLLPIEAQHPKKRRLHLDPRHTFKTTLGRVDSLQWVMAFPESITILNESATQPLAAAISKGIAIYFWREKGRAASLLQLAFPELVVDKEPKPVWNTPNHDVTDIDTTLAYTSPESSQSGWHPWVLNPDDMADTLNSGIHASSESRQRVKDTYDTNLNLLRHGGYLNLRGTRYHPFDVYGHVIEKMDPEQWAVLVRASLTVKSGRRLLPGEFPDEDDVVLEFPGLANMDYRSLRQKFFENYESFMCQQQNDPQGGSVAVFDEKLYQSMLVAEERVPGLGETFICWRLPYSGKPYMADKAEGIAARIWEGKVYVIDAWGGTYTPSRLAHKIVEEAKRHQTNTVMMEDLPGTQYMETHIRNEATQRNWSLRMQWLEFQEDDTDRMERMRSLEPQARAGRIWISTGTGRAAELRRQLLHFGLVEENGLVDCLSRMAAKVPMSLFRAEMEEEEREMQIRRRHEIYAQFVFGGAGGGYELEEKQQQAEAAQRMAMEAVQTFGLTDILGGLDG
jgi:hypothetical protein